MQNKCFSGLHMALVTKVGGDEKGLNQIETKLVSGGANGIRLDFAPVLTNSAGQDYGIVSLPKVGDFVIVAFLGNDIQRPVILGSIQKKKKKPPIKVSEKNNSRVHKTAGGMEIRIEEDDKEPQIMIKTKSGHTVILEDSSNNNLLNVKSQDGKTSLTMDLKKSTIELSAGEINLNAENKVAIKAGNSSVTISNSSGIDISSPRGSAGIDVNEINFKAKAAASISANAQINLQGSAGANLKSNGPTQVSGSLIKIG